MSAKPWLSVGAAAVLAAAASVNPATAHHSFSLFDANKNLALEGTVKDYQWTNPHVWIQLIVTDAAGKDVEWSIEAPSAAGLSRQGWSRQTMKRGDRITVVVHPLKDGTDGGSLVSATINGQTIGSKS